MSRDKKQEEFIFIIRTPSLGKKIFFQTFDRQWRGKIGDRDVNTPSCPHLHSLDKKFKLNVYTGEVYSVKEKSYTGKHIDEDYMIKLWHDPKFLEFYEKSCEMAKVRNPNWPLPEIPRYAK